MKQGFSLVELSIVLVIIGLLTGGVLAGKNLIRAAELRSVTTELRQYQAALHTFHDQYLNYPGDIPNATSLWGAQDGGDGLGIDCYYSPSSTPATCNGDGDGSISWAFGNETYRAWQHMANAGLVEGQYTGAPTNNPVGANTRYSLFGVNTPKSSYPNAGWILFTSGMSDGSSWAWPGDYTHIIGFGAQEPTDIMESAVLTPSDTRSIDEKVDDGMPGLGNMKTAMVSPGCATSVDPADVATARYNVVDTAVRCFFWFNWQ